MTALSWREPWTGVLHHVGAIILFAMFAIFALWLFRLTAVEEQPSDDKGRRNKTYMVCGIVIVVCMALGRY